MLQILDALTQTILGLAEKHGWKVAWAVLAFIGCGMALRLLARVVSAGQEAVKK